MAEAAPQASGFAFRHWDTHDADQHAESLSGWDQDYQQLSAGRFTGRLTDAWIDGIQIYREVTNQTLYQAGSCWAGGRTFCMVLGMQGEGVFCNQPVPEDAAAMFGSGGEFFFRTPRELDVIGIGVPDTVIESGSLALTGHAALAAPSGGPSIVGDSVALGALRDYLRALLARLEQDAGAFDQPAVRAGVTSTLLAGQLAVFAGGDSVIVADAGGGTSRRRLVDAAKVLVAARGEAPMTVPELTASLGVSMRTLEYAFRDVLGLSPVQYLRAARLRGVRRELLRANPAIRVSDAAARWGFWHLSQFAADYKRLFGELPSATLGRHRP